ncbi:MAG: DegT/DnrJ/EryC1/StrS family aminotransferase [Sedimentisphaerales bacterium]|nr:DegT/DnrJ/EryC1/StrS family aminotransferase [Sedimentisphaerales bacterium]
MSAIPSVIAQCDPKAGYLACKDRIDAAIARVLESGWYILGREVSSFEQEFRDYLGIGHAIGAANGTDALELALRACGVEPGDRVITVSHTAVATVAAIERAGAVPVLIDIDWQTFCLCPDVLQNILERSDRPSPKAIIPVHLYGYPADMPDILDLAVRYGLYVIEDCAQAHGAGLQGRKLGTWGDLATFSFYPTKNLGAIGDGGAVVTNKPELAEKVHLLREYGWDQQRISRIPGINSRLDEMQAAILREKLKGLDEDNEKRRQIARLYDEGLQESGLMLPPQANDVDAVYHQYVIRTKNRDDLKSWLRDRDILTAIHYPVPVHLYPAYQGRIEIAGSLRHTETVVNEILSLPMYAQLSLTEAEQVVEAINQWRKQKD